MAQSQPRPESGDDQLDQESWFSVSGTGSARHEQQQIWGPAQTAYQATSTRHRVHRSVSPGRSRIPLLSTSTPVNDKPLPPTPGSKKQKHKSEFLKSLVWRRSSDHLDPSHLQPGPSQRPKSSSSNANLSPDLQDNQRLTSSRNMPSSPFGFAYPPSPSHPDMERARSATANYPDTNQFQTYPEQPSRHTQHFASSHDNYAPQHSRNRPSFTGRATSASAMPDMQRPHTWLSTDEPNEPFHDASEYRLFVEATSGLPGGLEFSNPSPTSSPHLQLYYTRDRQNDQIPLPIQNPPVAQPPSFSSGGWQGMGYDYNSSQSPRPRGLVNQTHPRPDPIQQAYLAPNLHTINVELERLGVRDNGEDEDELPDYAQSQAEMHAIRRQEATNRARELEARWNSARRR